MLASGVSQFDVQFGMVDMADFKRPISMTRRLHFQFHVEGPMLIGGTRSLPFQGLLSLIPVAHPETKRGIAGRRNAFPLASFLQDCPRCDPALLLDGFVIVFDNFVHQPQGHFWQAARWIPTMTGPRQQSDVPGAEL